MGSWMLLRSRKNSPKFATDRPTYTRSKESGTALPWGTRLTYGTGHILNDLCASMWFTYLLLFFEKVLRFNTMYSGAVLTVGQIADGISTLAVGYFSDKEINQWLCIRYGKRKSWHLIGTFCVIISFPFIFLGCLGCSSEASSPVLQLVYYSVFVVVFQFGWAATQISHLAMIPDLTPCQDERTGLTAIRYTATVCSNISVYLLTWAFLGLGTATSQSVSPADHNSFIYVMVTCVAIGTATSTLFHLTVNPQRGKEAAKEEEVTADEKQEPQVEVERMSPLDWLQEPQMYQVAVVYMTTRLFVNLTQAYVPLYLQVTLGLTSSYVATIPLVMFLVGFVTSTLMKFVNHKIGRKLTFLLGCSLGMASCIWITFGCKEDSSYITYEVYGVAALIGAGGSTMLITSLSVTAELIGPNCDSAAFIYGAMSLTDKFSNGLVVLAVQSMVPRREECNQCGGCNQYYEQVLFYVCGGAALIGAAAMVTLSPFVIGRRFQKRKRRDESEPALEWFVKKGASLAKAAATATAGSKK